MNPFLETLAQILGLLAGLAALAAMVWGAARRQRGREAVDEQLTTKLADVTSSSTAHASTCDEGHKTHKDGLTKLDRRVMRLELEAGIEPPK